MPFGVVSEVSPRNRVFSAHWRHLANTVERLCASAVKWVWHQGRWYCPFTNYLGQFCWEIMPTNIIAVIKMQLSLIVFVGNEAGLSSKLTIRRPIECAASSGHQRCTHARCRALQLCCHDAPADTELCRLSDNTFDKAMKKYWFCLSASLDCCLLVTGRLAAAAAAAAGLMASHPCAIDTDLLPAEWHEIGVTYRARLAPGLAVVAHVKVTYECLYTLEYRTVTTDARHATPRRSTARRRRRRGRVAPLRCLPSVIYDRSVTVTRMRRAAALQSESQSRHDLLLARPPCLVTD